VVLLSTAKPEKKETSPRKKEIVPVKKKPARTTVLAPYRPWDIWTDFDKLFDNFRTNFEELLLPLAVPFRRAMMTMPTIETRIPYVDLEDRDKDFLLKAEMPGFKKEDIDIEATGDTVEIKAMTGWKYDEKTKKYICRERSCESFHRIVELPEEIKTEGVEADLKDGILEIVLPKKAPKPKKKVSIK
jgi:HSP20 family protein